MLERAARSAGDPAGGDDALEALVRAERVRTLFERNAVAQATVLLNSTIVVVVLWGAVTPGRLLPWAGVLWLLAAARLALGAAFRRTAPPPGGVERWARWFTAGAALNGVLWGAAPLLAGADLPLVHQLFFAFVLGGMSAGGALSNASRPSAFLAFTVPAFLPMVLRLLTGGDRLQVGAGVLLVVFAAAVTAISRSAGRSLETAIRLRFANQALARGLAELNAGLEARVAERSAELAAARERERVTERQLASATRLATIGTLAAGVAHEINNPLTYIKSNLGFVREELGRLGLGQEQGQALGEALADAGDGVERVRGFVRQLMALSRVEAGAEAQPVELRATLEQCLELARPEVQARARLHCNFGDVPRVMGDRIRLVQVFFNLLRNAAQAVPPGEPERHEVRLSTRRDPDGARVLVEVSDTGQGIPEASLESIWEPFFTTRSADEGVGLGLPTCRSLVGALGGTIAARSREGEGSTFTVWLRAEVAPPPPGQ